MNSNSWFNKIAGKHWHADTKINWPYVKDNNTVAQPQLLHIAIWNIFGGHFCWLGKKYSHPQVDNPNPNKFICYFEIIFK